jgi:EamA domain-containing membrane protein RarD
MYDIITRKGFNHIVLAAIAGLILKVTVVGSVPASVTFPVMFGLAILLGTLLLTPLGDQSIKWLGTSATAVGYALTLAAADANPGTWFTAFTLFATIACGMFGAVALMNAEGAATRIPVRVRG